MSVQVSDLTVTQGIVAKSGYTESTLSMERLVTWDSLKGIPSFSRGPKVCKIMHKMSWLATLKIFLEVVLVGLIGPGSAETHVDFSLLKSNKMKRTSSDDFEQLPKKSKTKKNTDKLKTMDKDKSRMKPREELPSWMEPSPSEVNYLSSDSNEKLGTTTAPPPSGLNVHELSESPISSPEPFGSPVVRIPNPIQIFSNQNQDDKTRTPRSKPSESPLVPFLNEIVELENSQLYTSLYKGRVLQVIGFNKMDRQGLLNIRVSDSEYWLDCNVDSSLRIYFDGDMIRVNDFIVIDGSRGTIGNRDFCISHLRKPGKLQVPKMGKVGTPLPLFLDGVNMKRGYELLNIKPLSQVSIPDHNTATEDPQNDVFNDSDDEDLLLATQNVPDNPTNSTNGDETLTLEELLNISYQPKKLTLADTPLGDSHVAEIEVKNNTINRYVFENARHMFLDRQYDQEKPEIKKNKIIFSVDSEFGNQSYNVFISWPELMPRTDRGFCKTFAISCTCGAFSSNKPKYCKHIVYVIMKHLHYG